VKKKINKGMESDSEEEYSFISESEVFDFQDTLLSLDELSGFSGTESSDVGGLSDDEYCFIEHVADQIITEEEVVKKRKRTFETASKQKLVGALSRMLISTSTEEREAFMKQVLSGQVEDPGYHTSHVNYFEDVDLLNNSVTILKDFAMKRYRDMVRHQKLRLQRDPLLMLDKKLRYFLVDMVKRNQVEMFAFLNQMEDFMRRIVMDFIPRSFKCSRRDDGEWEKLIGEALFQCIGTPLLYTSTQGSEEEQQKGLLEAFQGLCLRETCVEMEDRGGVGEDMRIHAVLITMKDRRKRMILYSLVKYFRISCQKESTKHPDQRLLVFFREDVTDEEILKRRQAIQKRPRLLQVIIKHIQQKRKDC